MLDEGESSGGVKWPPKDGGMWCRPGEMEVTSNAIVLDLKEKIGEQGNSVSCSVVRGSLVFESLGNKRKGPV
jgi:hypothetical protein